MACTEHEIKGLVNNCDSSKGGVTDIYIAIRPDGFKATDDAGIITGMTSGLTWYKYYIKKNVASFTSTLTVDQANGVNYCQTELSLVFTKMETLKRIELSSLALNDLLVIVKDANNKYWLLGKDNAAYVSGGTGESGTAAQDGNRYNLTISDESDTFLFEVAEAYVTANVLK